MKYGFTLTKIMREGTPSCINSHDNRHKNHIFVRVHRHVLFSWREVHGGHPHENNVVARFALVFSWQFFVVFRGRSPSWTDFVRVLYFMSHRHEMDFMRVWDFMRVTLMILISWEYHKHIENIVFRERTTLQKQVILWEYKTPWNLPQWKHLNPNSK